MQRVYKSKVSIGLLCTITAVSVIPTIPFLIVDFSWVIVAIVGLILFIALYILCSIKYIIDGDILTVECGILSRTNYRINDIRKIKNSDSILASPAASLDRIAVYFCNRHSPLIVSPREKDAFIFDLKKINPDIEVL